MRAKAMNQRGVTALVRIKKGTAEHGSGRMDDIRSTGAGTEEDLAARSTKIGIGLLAVSVGSVAVKYEVTGVDTGNQFEARAKRTDMRAENDAARGRDLELHHERHPNITRITAPVGGDELDQLLAQTVQRQETKAERGQLHYHGIAKLHLGRSFTKNKIPTHWKALSDHHLLHPSSRS